MCPLIHCFTLCMCAPLSPFFPLHICAPFLTSCFTVCTCTPSLPLASWCVCAPLSPLFSLLICAPFLASCFTVCMCAPFLASCYMVCMCSFSHLFFPLCMCAPSLPPPSPWHAASSSLLEGQTEAAGSSASSRPNATREPSWTGRHCVSVAVKTYGMRWWWVISFGGYVCMWACMHLRLLCSVMQATESLYMPDNPFEYTRIITNSHKEPVQVMPTALLIPLLFFSFLWVRELYGARYQGGSFSFIMWGLMHTHKHTHTHKCTQVHTGTHTHIHTRVMGFVTF